MAKIFPEEQELLDKLLEEWYAAIKAFTEQADGIFSERAQKYDRIIPAWESLNFPVGFAHEIRKKIDRVSQHLDNDDGVNWDGVAEELRDITNYARMMGGVILMLKRRGTWPQQPSSSGSSPGTEQGSTTNRSTVGAPTRRRQQQPSRG